MKRRNRHRLLACATIAATLGSPTVSAVSTGPRPAPEWVQHITPGTWAEISLNTLHDVDPARDPEVNPNYPSAPAWRDNQPAVLGAWNGGAFAPGYGPSGALIVAGGGHADYYGNEVYAFDLASRRWQRLTNPYRTPFFPVTDGIWPDGTPSVSHTYDQVDYHPATNSFVMMKTQYDNTGGKSTPIVAMLSLDNLKPPDTNANRDANARNWRLSPRNDTNYTNSGGWSAYDSKRDLFWANGGNGTESFVSFDPNPARENGRFGAFRSYQRRTSITDAVAAYDPVNDLVVFTVFRAAPNVWAIDLSDPGAGNEGNAQLTQTGTPPLLESAHGWEWSPTRRAFLYYRRGAGVYEFALQGGNWRSDPWRWGELTASANEVTPEGDLRNGVYSKFRIATFSDAEVALVVTRADGPVYAFRVPGRTTPAGPKAPKALTAD